jgi:hypothetical protein
MSRLISYMSTSLDGFINRPGDDMDNPFRAGDERLAVITWWHPGDCRLLEGEHHDGVPIFVPTTVCPPDTIMATAPTRSVVVSGLDGRR